MGFWDIMSALGALAIIILVLVATYYASRWYARRVGGTGVGKHVKVHDRVSMGNAGTLIIVEVSGRFYLLGMSEKNIQMLCELPDFDPDASLPEDPRANFAQSFSDILQRARGKIKDDGGEESNGS